MLWILYRLSLTHTWVLPIFSVGLGAPRWCQVSRIKRAKYCPMELTQELCTDVLGHKWTGYLRSVGWRGRKLRVNGVVALVSTFEHHPYSLSGHIRLLTKIS